ncbi:YcbK family protein [Arenibaculum pallidiluteum]|uniref:YcbK family protein n=1 Tax=Arenibaculum pallidiluteum TaxID=2812559 RepID=UPI001A97875F|nr:DUF882 domain-containing protein [Arenibaculum pallidiluteum]
MAHSGRFAALTLLLLGACAAAPPLPPSPVGELGAARSLTLQHPWSGETARAVYRRGDVYDPQGLSALAQVMRDRRTGEVGPLDPALADLFWDLRTRLGLPEEAPIHVVSGYRSPRSNATLARTDPQVAENSYHLRGMAADIRIPGVDGDRLVQAARALGRGGWAFYPRSKHLHVDVGPQRTWQVR